MCWLSPSAWKVPYEAGLPRKNTLKTGSCNNNTRRIAHTMVSHLQQAAHSTLIFHRSFVVSWRPDIQWNVACLLPNASACSRIKRPRRTACQRQPPRGEMSRWCHQATCLAKATHAIHPVGEFWLNSGSGFTAEWCAVLSHCSAQQLYCRWVNFGEIDSRKCYRTMLKSCYKLKREEKL